MARIPIQAGIPNAIAVNPNIGTIYVTAENQLISINASTYAVTDNDVSISPLNCSVAIGFDNDVFLSCTAMTDMPSFIVMDESGSIINSFTQSGSPAGVAVGDGVYLVNQNGYVLLVLYSPPTLPP